MKGKSLGEARKLFRARKFTEVIRLLEPEVFRHRESFEYFWMLGLSCLHTADLGGAFSYVKRAHQLRDADVGVLLALAVIHFRRAENESAIRYWLKALEAQPSNPVARRGLDFLRRGLTTDELQELIDSGRLRLLYPPLQRRAPGRPLAAALLAVIVLAGLGYLGYRVTRPSVPERPGVAGIEIPGELSLYIEPGSDFTFVFTERQVIETFQRAKKELLAYRDNRAAVEINRLLLSNAALAIRERARMLKGFVTQASFDTLQDPFSYAAVAEQPALYEACSVRWKGKIANLRVGKEAITFDLLVGYDQEKELEGIVPVTLPFASVLEDGSALEVLGQVTLHDGTLALLGISLHKLASP